MTVKNERCGKTFLEKQKKKMIAEYVSDCEEELGVYMSRGWRVVS